METPPSVGPVSLLSWMGNSLVLGFKSQLVLGGCDPLFWQMKPSFTLPCVPSQRSDDRSADPFGMAALKGWKSF